MKLTIRRNRILLFLWIAAAYLAIWILHDIINGSERLINRVINNIWLVAYLVVLNFLLFEYAVPFLRMRWKRILAAPFLLFAFLMLYSFGFYAWRFIGIQLHIYTEIRKHENMMAGIEFHVPYSFFSIFFFGVIRYTYDFRKLRETAQKLRIEKQEAELNYLKSQTNPHFLFNTLNNIYVLARDKSDLAPESILRLSKILRYMLYEAGGAFIAVEQELKVISDYIALEQLRYDSTLQVNFNYDVEDMRQALPPLLLIPLVENAFKHGVSETRHRPFINLHLSINNRKLSFTVKNSSENSEPGATVKENIGLSNLRRQLELLYGEYNLAVQQGAHEFTAHLQINLASHVPHQVHHH